MFVHKHRQQNMSKKNQNAVISRNKADINLDTTALDPNSTGT